MPGTDFLPKRDSELVTWSNNFDTLITASAPSYGLTVAQASAYNTLHDAFVSAFQVSSNPSTNSHSSVVVKNDAREALVDNARTLAGIIQANPDVTNQQRSDLGLTVRDTEPTPIPVPADPPGLQIVSAVGRSVTIRLHDTANPDNRGKPDGVDGATVLSFIGSAPPAPEDIDSWKFEGNISRVTTVVNLPATVPSGATAWFTAFWFNPRKQSGPAAQPISTQIPGSLPAAA